ncbi:hypothetical protein EV648_104303 [Kribbella sp. VKM Ac-2568]|nr:hypothetical protein EV648_104303 [Kribbella sp. VKM Ac-2568]
MTSNAKMVERNHHLVPLMHPDRLAPEQPHNLRHLRNPSTDRRQRVSRIINNDRDGKLVKLNYPNRG